MRAAPTFKNGEAKNGAARSGGGRAALSPQSGLVSPTSTEQALRAHLRSHNRGVLAASAVALFFSLLGWTALYGFSYWVALLTLTIARNGETEKPAEFNAIFFGSAAAVLLAARVDQWLFPHERAVDERPKVEHLADILFFVPRFTMSCWQNLGALARLRGAEVPDAARLLDALKRQRRVSLQELPAQWPDARARPRMIEALFVAGLIDQRREDDVTWRPLSALAPAVFRASADALPAPDDPLAGVPQVKIRRRVPLLRKRAGEE